MPDWLRAVRFNEQGLVSVIAIDVAGVVLMQAWMNAQALQMTLAAKEMIYYSRSRNALWRKGEQSGHRQLLLDMWLDCDGDALLARVTQIGAIACHTGRQSCFYRRWHDNDWHDDAPILKSSEEIYGK